MAILKQFPVPSKPDELEEKVNELRSFVLTAAENATAAHETEAGIWRQLLDIGRTLMGNFFEHAGSGDLGETLEVEGGRQLRRLPREHARAYQSIFGTYELSRAVYGTREGQRIELVPLDQRLNLPKSKFSYLLQDWDQQLAVENSFTEVDRVISKILHLSQSVDSLERMNRKMSESVVDYWDSLPAPDASEEAELLVLSADGKGVPIRHGNPSPRGGALASPKGIKPGAKKMALLAASYTVDRRERTPKEVVASLFREHASPSAKSKEPGPCHKRLRASLARDEKETTEPAQDEIFGWLAMEAQERDPDNEKPVLLLMDGQHDLWTAAESKLPARRIEILDLLHVTPRLWKAAHLFFRESGSSAKKFVRERVERILNGKVGSVIRGLRQMATRSGLTGRKRKQLERICQYFERHRSRMRYDEYLAQGYPIATGVIEGACRHVVKDRMERTGMQWVLEGAQAMLDLRTVHLGGHWDDFCAYRTKKESERLYPHREVTETVEWPLAA